MRINIAARKVYEDVLLRLAIFRAVNDIHRGTLARMMRLEKAARESVTGVLYEKMTASVLSMLLQTTTNKALFNAIKTIDLSPPPAIPDFGITQGIPIILDEAYIRDLLSFWYTKCPNLQKIINWSPTNEWDDHFTIHIRRGLSTSLRVYVDIESQVHYPISGKPFNHPDLPLIPEIQGMTIRHTICLHLMDTPSKSHIAKLREYLYFNENLDRRIVGINHAGTTGDFDLAPADLTAFFTRRKEGGCESMTTITLPYDNEIKRNDFRTLVDSFGTSSRCLHIDESMLHYFNDIQQVLTLFDGACPFLQHLTFIYTRDDKRAFHLITPLTGMPHLRTFTFEHMGGHATPRIVQFIGKLGGQDTVFYNIRSANGSERAVKGFNVLCRNMKRIKG